MSLLSGPTLSVKLAEPFVFVTTPNRGQAGRQPAGPALVRGLLVLKLPKATKITSIDVLFDGKATTDWPEGVCSKPFPDDERDAYFGMNLVCIFGSSLCPTTHPTQVLAHDD